MSDEHGSIAKQPDPGAEEAALWPIAALFRDGANATAIFGEPVRDGSCTVVPVAKAMWGLGGGSGPQGTGSGAGGGVHVRPIGFIQLSKGRARFRRIGMPWMLLGGAAVAGAIAATGVRRLRLKTT